VQAKASEPILEGKMYHIALGKGDIPPYVLMPGDPERVDKIAQTWDEYTIITQHREYRSARGKYKGVEIGALSTGIGGPSTAIAIEELARIGVHTMIRVGTTGAIQEYIKPGDIIIAAAAVRLDGASMDYAPPEYPAYSSADVLMALIEAAESLGVRYHVGVVASTTTFHLGQTRHGFKNYMWSGVERRLDDLRAMGVLSFEMETATIFTLASIYGLRAGSVCAAIANRVTDEFVAGAGVLDAIKVANEAVRILAEADKLRGGFMEKPLTASLIARVAAKH